MPHHPRLVVPGYPHHVVARGHNRQVIFAEPGDYRLYLATLAEFKQAYGVKLFGYCLMSNHVHLLLEPSEPTGLGKLMKRLGGRQTRHFNRVHGCSGTAWEGRPWSSVVDRESYLLACCRYIELNPVRARIVSGPLDYAWSSCRQRFGLEQGCLDLDAGFLALGASLAECRAEYRDFLEEGVPEPQRDFIRSAVRQGHLTGGDDFTDKVGTLLGRKIEMRKPGRPPRSTAECLPASLPENRSVPISLPREEK